MIYLHYIRPAFLYQMYESQITHLPYFSFIFIRLLLSSSLFPYTTLFRSLVVNLKISYKGKHKKDELFSIGLHLVNGMMKVEMMDILKKFTLQDRKSTRLNSSHVAISYAVFCLKKKKKNR